MKRKYEIIKTNEKGERVNEQPNRVLRKISELGVAIGTVGAIAICLDIYISSQEINYMIL